VSQERIDDFVQSITMTCTPADIDVMVNNLSLLGFLPAFPSNEKLFLDLWDVLQFSARR
jgi:hypothetical protein